jgi:hypothetical protein
MLNPRNHSIRLDPASASLLYIGEAAAGQDESVAGWRIRKFETVATISSMKWADGDEKFDNIWANRAALSYS